MKKNVAGQKIGAEMITAADGTAFTGSVTVSVTLDAGTQATGSVGSGACTHEGNGYHTYAPAQAETNGDLLAFTFTGTGAVPATVQVFASFPQTGDSFPLLPAALVGGRMDASVGAMAASVLTATAIAADAITDAKVASDVTIASVTGAVGSVTGAVGSVTGLTAATVHSDLDDIQARLPAALTAGGNIKADVLAWNGLTTVALPATPTNITAGTITTVTNLTNAPTAGDLTATMKTSVTTAATAATPVAASVTGAVGSVAAGGITAASIATDAIDADALAADALAEIKAQIVAALNTDTYAESSAVPAATATLVAKIAWLATLSRNKITQTATTQLVRNDGDAATLGTSTVSDDGTTFTRGKFA